MFDASSLLGGMLSGGFGRKRSSGSGMLGTVATVGGLAAVGGLGYMAYRHFAAQPGAHAGPPGWGGGAPGAPGFGPPGMGGAPGAAPGWGGAPVPGAPPGVGGWGAPPGAPGAPGQPGGVGGFVQGLMGSSTGLQKGGFGGPGYEYQSGGAMAAAAPAYPPFAPLPGMGAPGAGAPGMGAPGMGAAGMGASAAFPGGPPPAGFGATAGPPAALPGAPPAPAAVVAPPGAVSAVAPGGPTIPAGPAPIPPPPVFDPTTGQVTSAPAPAAVALPGPAAAAPVGPAQAGAPVDPMPHPDASTQASAMLLVRAMVAAANADGVIDDVERKDILERLAATGVGPEEQAALAQELDRPKPVAALVAEVSSPDLARQFYAVSLLAIEIDNAAEKLHMKALPAMLGLSPEDVAKIHADLGVPAL